jgi:hypothetical protein
MLPELDMTYKDKVDSYNDNTAEKKKKFGKTGKMSTGLTPSHKDIKSGQKKIH